MNSEFSNEEIFPAPTQPTTPPDQSQAAPETRPEPISAPTQTPIVPTPSSSWQEDVREPVTQETEFIEARRMPPQVVNAVVVAPPRKLNRLALTVILLCAVLIVILCMVSRDFRMVFFLASAIWIVLHTIIRVFKL